MCELVHEHAASLGATVISVPEEAVDEGYLGRAFQGSDETHGNAAYGEVMLRAIHQCIIDKRDGKRAPLRHPYLAARPYQRWSKSIGEVPYSKVDPAVAGTFRIERGDKIATAGSCFAQHIARRLATSGFNYYVEERGHPMVSPSIAAEWGYGLFSCRFGNIYTARQLRQLFNRAYGAFTPADSWWENGGRFFDPLRPAIQPGGFHSVEALVEDRRIHLAHVRKMFETMDIFVLTLGLTEFWEDARDGTAFPVCPGVSAGVFQPERHVFRNQSIDEVREDLATFISDLRAVNPSVRLIITVSPVPLAATAVDRHVLVSTTYSKAVLRVAAEEMTTRFQNVTYFPSYEIITGAFNRGRYYGPDLREVDEAGVDHVMRLFFLHYTDVRLDAPAEVATQSSDQGGGEVERIQRLVAAVCEERLLDAPDQMVE